MLIPNGFKNFIIFPEKSLIFDQSMIPQNITHMDS